MKNCIKCGAEKPLSEYYSHPKMADGHLGKCKVCCREASRQQMQRIVASPEWRERELTRHREKARRYREAGILPSVEAQRKGQKARRERNQVKREAHSKLAYAIKIGEVWRAPCIVCGRSDSEGHHEDYSKPLDVVWYCPTHHAERHVEIRREARMKKHQQQSEARKLVTPFQP